MTPHVQTLISPATPDSLNKAALLLRAGHLVAFPTETVYGLGADGTQDKAVAAIFEAKGRPTFNPLILHVTDFSHAGDFIIPDDRARLLAAHFWPGPLTLVLPRSRSCAASLLVSAGLDTIAIRAPAHPIAQALIHETGRPLAAPSANRSGGVSPTTPLHVKASLDGRLPLILAGGKCAIGVESTVLDLSGPTAMLLRPGAVLESEIAALIGPLQTHGGLVSGQPLKSPGQLSSHYAPKAKVRLNVLIPDHHEAFLAFGPTVLPHHDKPILNLSPEGDLTEAAANLFAMLHTLDAMNVPQIAVAPIPCQGLGMAINDRLTRAAAPR